MRTTKIWILAYAMLAALSLASCRQSAQKTEMGAPDKPCGEDARMLTQNCR